MKKNILFGFLFLFFVNCTSIKEHNEQLENTISVEKLQSDVAFIYKKFQQLHPRLYWYIDKSKLDFKFDSLSKSITKPLKSFDFYKKIAPVIAEIRQGHSGISADAKQQTKQQVKALLKKGIGPFSQFDFENIDNKMVVVKNNSYNKKINIGSEVVAINGKKTTDYINEYCTLFASDGYNTTFKKPRAVRNFSKFYTNENDIQDSLFFDFKFRDSVKTICIHRKKMDSITAKSKPTKTAFGKEIRKKNKIEGYNPLTKLYNRNLRFEAKDSSVAVLKIRGFSIGNSSIFYENAFKKIKQFQSKTLIIDLRDNPGGRLSEIADLYAYLSDTSFVFIDKPQVVSKTSLFSINYFAGPWYLKPFQLAFSPLFYGYLYFKVHRDSTGQFIYNTNTAKLQPKDPNAFAGKIYVLINGGSFSASCILSSNLKGAKRAFFVGQETGGAYNGTVAGQMPIVKLPHSKLKARIGLALIAPHFKTNLDGRGIFPDQEILPTIEDKIKRIDPEMNWILAKINLENP